MQYVSTRGGMATKSFSEILLAGLADDGGLSICEHYPQITDQELTNWRALGYPELAFEIISRFATDIPSEDLREIINKTYTAEKFGSEDITPLNWLNDDLAILGLSNGPTLAFKDIAMQLLGNLFEYILTKNNQELNILGATSGDTGPSAEYAMLGKSHVRVFMLSPHQRMSPFQEAQMYSLDEPNIFNIAVEGSFDRAQDMVKGVSHDAEFKARYKIGTVNSINWARVTAQVVYYFKGYLDATVSNNQKVSFTVPSGNFGNIYAGHIARQMGLPIEKLVLATNENNVLDEFFRTGVYRVRDENDVHITSSPSMDISKASNFERFIYDLVGRNPKIVAELWSQVESNGYFDLSNTEYFEKIQNYGFKSGSSNHQDRIEIIREIKSHYDLVIDTHTADGIKVAKDFRQEGIPMICLETALPAKFEATVIEALGHKPDRPANHEGIEDKPRKYDVMKPNIENIKTYIEQRLSS